jgi:hypothetical protein
LIENVVEDFLDSVAEREFDPAFLALLRGHSFRDIHFLHGQFEFGKDFIAKQDGGDSIQFAFQSKAGDLNLGDWRALRSQLDETRRNALAHPSFDSSLPRRAVVVLTGRLVGGAALEAQEYGRYLVDEAETSFEVWDREKLVELLVAMPEAALAGAPAEAQFLSVLGSVGTGKADQKNLEEYSRSWIAGECEPKSHLRAAIQLNILAEKLRRANRRDLAAYVCLTFIRAVWADCHGHEPAHEHALELADSTAELFDFYVDDLVSDWQDEWSDPRKFIDAHVEPLPLVTYPVRCLRFLELVGLLIWRRIEKGTDCIREVELIQRICSSHPGSKRPVSDRQAVALIPVILTMAFGTREALIDYIKSITKWVCDQYDAGWGLASHEASPLEEIEYLLGPPLENIEREKREASYVCSVLADMCSVLELRETLDDVINEFLAVGALPQIVEAADTAGQYLRKSSDLRWEVNVPYETPSSKATWESAPHHSRNSDYYLQRIGRCWHHLAVSAVLRDRHFVSTLRQLAVANSLVKTEEGPRDPNHG